MLNISTNTVIPRIGPEKLEAFKRTTISNAHRLFTRWLMGSMFFMLVLMFLPWTQNIQSKGQVTTLQPGQRPQTIQSTIAGRIEKWYVREGQLVKRGDTIVHLSEIKAEYFDPDLVQRTDQQVDAKEGAIESYNRKVDALENQIQAMKTELEFKQKQLANKILQTQFKLASDSAELVQAFIQDSLAIRQFERTRELFNTGGIKSRADVEDKKSKVQETNAKYISMQNRLQSTINELDNARLELFTVLYEYNQKIAKAESDKFSTLSQMYDAEASVNKLRIDASNYLQRSQFYYIVAPQDCYITQAIKPGIGETVKEGEGIVTIMPADYELAVELYIKPMDLPLVNMGQEVRFIFDGWPAFIFSGWPGLSFGTYQGEIVAIDNDISGNKLYRILISERPSREPWPEALRVGSGVQGIALLNNVPLWYEIWRQLNGFPPDYYDIEKEDLKLKAPIRSVK